MKTMLFNPYTGKPRDRADIASDPSGTLAMDPDELLEAENLAAMVGRLAHLVDPEHPTRKQAMALLSRLGYKFTPHSR